MFNASMELSRFFQVVHFDRKEVEIVMAGLAMLWCFTTFQKLDYKM